MRFIVLASSEFAPYARMCVDTIRHHHPTARVVHMTGDDVDIGAEETWRSAKLDPKHPPTFIRERMALLAGMDEEPTAVLDADTLVYKPLDDLWQHDFEVALTWRPHQPTMPYNCGVMFLRGTRFPQALLARMDAEPRYCEPFGDQEALALEADSGRWRLRVLQCSEWNNSDVNNDCVPPARIAHYKGARKEYMVRHYLRGVWK